MLHCTSVTFVARRHVPRLAIKSSLGRTRTEHSCGRARFKEPFGGEGGRLHGPGGGPRCGGERKVEAASEKIASGCYILRDRDGARPARAAARYLIWLLSEPRVAVFWPGIVLRGFTFISILITRSLGSRFGTRYPSSTYTHTLLFLLLLLPRSFLSPSPLLLSRLQLPPPLSRRRRRRLPARSKIRLARRALKLRASSVLHLSPLRK